MTKSEVGILDNLSSDDEDIVLRELYEISTMSPEWKLPDIILDKIDEIMKSSNNNEIIWRSMFVVGICFPFFDSFSSILFKLFDNIEDMDIIGTGIDSLVNLIDKFNLTLEDAHYSEIDRRFGKLYPVKVNLLKQYILGKIDLREYVMGNL